VHEKLIEEREREREREYIIACEEWNEWATPYKLNE
jgi:hypothetical protein